MPEIPLEQRRTDKPITMSYVSLGFPEGRKQVC